MSGPVSDDDVPELANLRRQIEDLRQAVRARDDFIVIAAHELRNPMTPILGVAELALLAAQKAEGTLPSRIIALLERLQLLIQGYMKRATRLLDISRLDAGNLQLEPAPTDLSNLARAVLQRYEAEAVHQDCLLQRDIEDGIVALCDPLAAEQIVENLLSNALKFGAGRPVTLSLRAEKGSARFDVLDGGIGMSVEQQGRIFGRFEQVVGNHSGSGFGLGLWIASRLVEAMDGRISVSSRTGEGSIFSVVLPLLPASHRSERI
jgi:two-component system, OmpR family, sensor kinase